MELNPKPTKWAVLIGIDHYEYDELVQTTPRYRENGTKIEYKNLSGSVNDALAIRHFLINTMKVKPECIWTLLAPTDGVEYLPELVGLEFLEPTYNNIVETLVELCDSVTKGDLVYVQYSGHGCRATTVFKELKKDKVDHCFVPTNITRGGNLFRGLEFGALLQDIVDKDAVLTVVLDSCHSGDAVRGDDDNDKRTTSEMEGIRLVPGIYRSNSETEIPNGKALEAIKRWGNTSWIKVAKGFVVLTACLDYQEAKEINDIQPDKTIIKHGRLTYWLLDVLRKSGISLSTRAIYNRVLHKVPRNGDQMPNIIGDNDRFFFDQKFRSKVYAISVGSVKPGSSGTIRSIELAGGKFHGIRENSEYAILPLTSDLGTPICDSDILARVKVEALMTASSITSFVNRDQIIQWDKIVVGCPAVLQKQALEARYKVHFLAASEDQRKTFERCWDCHGGNRNRLRLVQERKKADFIVSLDLGHVFIITIGDTNVPVAAWLDPLLWPSKDSSISMLINRLEHLAAFKLIEGLDNPGFREADLPNLIDWKVEPALEGGFADYNEYISPAEKIVENNGVHEARERELFSLVITNKSKSPVGCSILNLNFEFGINIVFPEENRKTLYTIPEGETVRVNQFVYVPDHLVKFTTGWKVTDHYKIFISTTERDLDSLRLSSISEMEESVTRGDAKDLGKAIESLDDLLESLTPLTRHSGGVSPLTKVVGDWQTIDIFVGPSPSMESEEIDDA